GKGIEEDDSAKRDAVRLPIFPACGKTIYLNRAINATTYFAASLILCEVCKSGDASPQLCFRRGDKGRRKCADRERRFFNAFCFAPASQDSRYRSSSQSLS